MSLCIACQTPTNKYKCPSCQEPYCSLHCYKEHQSVHTGLDGSPHKQDLDIQLKQSDKNNEPTFYDPFKTEDTVPRAKLEELRRSEELHALLCNKHLRNLLQDIDVASDAWRTMRAAMQEPLFVEFADACLKVVEPLSETEA